MLNMDINDYVAAGDAARRASMLQPDEPVSAPPPSRPPHAPMLLATTLSAPAPYIYSTVRYMCT